MELNRIQRGLIARAIQIAVREFMTNDKNHCSYDTWLCTKQGQTYAEHKEENQNS